MHVYACVCISRFLSLAASSLSLRFASLTHTYIPMYGLSVSVSLSRALMHVSLRDEDHIHEGNGFITQHIKMDLIFQASMQAVDPSVTLPYWDFTM